MCFKFDENYKFGDPKSSINPRTRHMKKTTSSHFTVKLFKINRS